MDCSIQCPLPTSRCKGGLGRGVIQPVWTFSLLFSHLQDKVNRSDKPETESSEPGLVPLDLSVSKMVNKEEEEEDDDDDLEMMAEAFND